MVSLGFGAPHDEIMGGGAATRGVEPSFHMAPFSNVAPHDGIMGGGATRGLGTARNVITRGDVFGIASRTRSRGAMLASRDAMSCGDTLWNGGGLAMPIAHSERLAQPIAHSEGLGQPSAHSERLGQPIAHSERLVQPNIHREGLVQPNTHRDGPAMASAHRDDPMHEGADIRNAPRVGFWEQYREADGNVRFPPGWREDGTFDGVPNEGNRDARETLPSPFDPCHAERRAVLNHTNPTMLMCELRYAHPELAAVPYGYNHERAILAEGEVVQGAPAAYPPFCVQLDELVVNGFGGLVVRDGGSTVTSVLYSPFELLAAKTLTGYPQKFSLELGGYTVWAVDCSPPIPGAVVNATMWNIFHWPTTMALMTAQGNAVRTYCALKEQRLAAARVAQADAQAQAQAYAAHGQAQAAAAQAQAYAAHVQAQGYAAHSAQAAQAAQAAAAAPAAQAVPVATAASAGPMPAVALGAVPMDAENARVPRPEHPPADASTESMAAYGRHVAAYVLQQTAARAAKAVAKEAEQAAIARLRAEAEEAARRLVAAEAAARVDAEVHIPEEVRPSRGSTDVRPASGRVEERQPTTERAGKEQYKPAPPLRYSGDDSKVRVELWLRSMMSYLQLTNTQPSRWALVAESYLSGTAQIVWNSTSDALHDTPTWTNLSDCLLKHFADRYAAQKLLKQLDVVCVEGGLSTVTVQAMTRSVITMLEQHAVTPGVVVMDLGTQCRLIQAALRRGWAPTGMPGGLEGDKARALARKLDSKFNLGELPDLTAMADFLIKKSPSVDDAAALKVSSRRGDGGAAGGTSSLAGGGLAPEVRGGGKRRDQDKGKGPRTEDPRNGNNKRPADGGARQSKGKEGGSRKDDRSGGKGKSGGSGTYVTDDVKAARMLWPDLCWKCEQKGHFANKCTNVGKPTLGEAYKKPPPSSGR